VGLLRRIEALPAATRRWFIAWFYYREALRLPAREEFHKSGVKNCRIRKKFGGRRSACR